MDSSNNDEQPTSVDPSKIPLSLNSAIDVTEEEYRRAKRQRVYVFLTSALGILLGFLLLGLSLLVVPLGIAGYIIGAAFFEESKKMATTRMRVYPVLRVFLAGREIDSSAGETDGE